MISISKRAAAVLVACPLFVSTAFAAGFDFDDHGARALGMGGAHAGLPDDGTAIYYNPAGLTAIPGITVTLDNQFIWQAVSYQRTDASGTRIGPTVENGAGAFYSPVLSITWAATERLHLALSAHGPPAVGKLEYADIDLGTPQAQMNGIAPQRYSLIDRNVLIAYPGAAAAYRITDWLSVGGTLQVVWASNDFEQNILGSTGDQRVHVKATGVSGIAGILGVTARVMPGLHVGASWRPHFDLKTDGTIRVNPYVALPLAQRGDKIEFTVPFPDVIRFGLDWRGGLTHLAADFNYETWSQVDRFTIHAKEPIDFVLTTGAGDVIIPFGENQYIDRRWDDAWSVRLGAEYGAVRVGAFGLTPRVGALYESSAIPDSRLDVSFPNWERYSVNAGLTTTWRRASLVVGYGHIFQPDKEVRNSTVLANVAPSPTPGGPPPAGADVPVANGDYSSSYNLLSIGLALKFQ